MSDFTMPNFYREMFPGGPAGPLRWQDEQSGVLPAAVLAYFEHRQTPAQLKLVVEYLRYYLHAPCWDDNPYLDEEGRAELAGLRARITEIQQSPEVNEHKIETWIWDCLEMGIDPL